MARAANDTPSTEPTANGSAHAQTRLNRCTIYILPTRHGLLFAAVLLVMLLGAANYENALGYALTFVLVSVALVSILHTHRNLNGLALSARADPPVFAGEPARFTLTLANERAQRRAAISVRRKDGDGEALVLDVAPAIAVSASLSQPTRERGWCVMDEVVIATRYPFGLFRAWSRVRLDARCLVYPSPGGTAEPPRLANGSHAGAIDLASAGYDDLSALRPYRRGDPLKHVNWRAVAGERPMLVKVFSGESSDTLALRFSALTGAPERRLSELCRWVLLADRDNASYSLELPGASLAPGSGRSHRNAALSALALFEA